MRYGRYGREGMVVEVCPMGGSPGGSRSVLGVVSVRLLEVVIQTTSSNRTLNTPNTLIH